ncbi:MAG TPA: polyprenol monophosphomannose synthase [Candidatus Hydrogenedentes bacterium]|jgi:dolichol-phosphate mannosyltransferase|nr:polyprenol monophosphomannose synthase [Candidatus Hydrogenedentota bacterium]HPJ97970.1 polyprenol monophosphomannose synthase [Candidatus Hydrogenedentota bacterium]
MSADSVVIIPTYNEAQNIQRLISAIQDACSALDIVIVDDASPDGTGELAASMEGVHVIRRPGKLGLGTAYVAGFCYALGRGYQRIAGMDADFSHDPSVLPALFALLDTADVGIGSRYVPGGGTRNWGLHRQILSRTANIFARFMLGLPIHDVTSGYRCYRREVLERIDLDTLASHGYSFLVELLYRSVQAGFSVAETPIIFEDRARGTSKMSLREIVGGIKNLFRLRRTEMKTRS